jgi:hypothetical protein
MFQKKNIIYFRILRSLKLNPNDNLKETSEKKLTEEWKVGMMHNVYQNMNDAAH